MGFESAQQVLMPLFGEPHDPRPSLAGVLTLATVHSRRGATVPPAHGEPAASMRLHGTVASLSDAPVPRAAVWVLSEVDDSVRRTTADAMGRYALDDVPEGTHQSRGRPRRRDCRRGAALDLVRGRVTGSVT
ncbi:hypothetical protein GCM10010240_45030 [Streptomyces griseoviridis]|nr:hypothetical protein GCM10010240_45030 [Streptomyces griseoviridis]